jgi:hypothetical protein
MRYQLRYVRTPLSRCGATLTDAAEEHKTPR